MPVHLLSFAPFFKPLRPYIRRFSTDHFVRFSPARPGPAHTRTHVRLHFLYCQPNAELLFFLGFFKTDLFAISSLSSSLFVLFDHTFLHSFTTFVLLFVSLEKEENAGETTFDTYAPFLSGQPTSRPPLLTRFMHALPVLRPSFPLLFITHTHQIHLSALTISANTFGLIISFLICKNIIFSRTFSLLHPFLRT